MPRFCRPLGLSAISPYLHGRDLVAAQIIFLAKKDVSMYKTLKYNGSRIYGQLWDQLKLTIYRLGNRLMRVSDFSL